jgi:quercetin dioxygenase-like cupin family protein
VLLAKANATREVELWEWRLEPGEHYPSEPDADGWSEQFYVFEGCLTLMVGDVPHRISAGEFFMFASNQPFLSQRWAGGGAFCAQRGDLNCLPINTG